MAHFAANYGLSGRDWLSGRTLAVPSVVVTMTQPPVSLPYESYHFYAHFTTALTRDGDCVLPFNDYALRCAFGSMLSKARENRLVNGNVFYDFYRGWLAEANKVTYPQERHESMMRVRQCNEHDENDPKFVALAQLFRTAFDAALQSQQAAQQHTRSTRRTRRSASTASTARYSTPSPPSP